MRNSENSFLFSPIGYVHSPFKDRFGVPRQPGLVPQAKGIVKLNPDPDLITALRKLDEFSHIWIIFVFHSHGGKNWKPSVRPPRLGGQKKVGVLASRSPHRPNPIGISAVKLDKIDLEAEGGAEIHVSGLDLIDQTPVLDIKPYVPYADHLSEATPGWAGEVIQKVRVHFSSEANKNLALRDPDGNLRKFIVEVLELDPRPAFQKRQNPAQQPITKSSQYGISLAGFDVKYEIRDDGFWVLKVL